MTIYDLINEDDHHNIYNILMNPAKVLIDPLQTGIRPDGQVTFTCHMKRGSSDMSAKTKYDRVKFIGYFREFVCFTFYPANESLFHLVCHSCSHLYF